MTWKASASSTSCGSPRRTGILARYSRRPVEHPRQAGGLAFHSAKSGRDDPILFSDFPLLTCIACFTLRLDGPVLEHPAYLARKTAVAVLRKGQRALLAP